MLLTAAVTKEEVVALVDAITPMRIVVDDERGRTITLGRPHVELVPDAGVRLRGDARITWDVAGMNVPVTLRSWQVLFVPRVVTRGRHRALAFDPVLEQLDLKGVPGFLDGKIARAIGDSIAQNRDKLAWSFGERLSRRFALPTRIGGGAFALFAVDGAAGVTGDDLKLTLRFEATVTRDESRVPASARDAAPRSRRAPTSERRPEIG